MKIGDYFNPEEWGLMGISAHFPTFSTGGGAAKEGKYSCMHSYFVERHVLQVPEINLKSGNTDS